MTERAATSRESTHRDWARHGVLLIGGTGMLGRAMGHELHRRGVRYDAPSPESLDLTRADHLARHIAAGACRTVINCAAYTDVDGAEASEALATSINGTAMAHLAAACRHAGAVLVNYGTDYVFNGRGSSPYTAAQPREPLNAYGRSKAAGEAALERAGAAYLQIRTSWLYAPWGKNFVRTIAALGKTKPVLKVVDDQRGRPTSAEHLAAATLDLLDHGARGVLAVTDATPDAAPPARGISWFEFAREIVRLTSGTARVEPCTSAEYPRPATRPAYSVLDLDPAEALIGPRPAWTATLTDVCRRLET